MTKKCQLCKKRIGEIDFFGEKICQKCVNECEEEMDISDLYIITDRRGKEWILERLNELVSIETIK